MFFLIFFVLIAILLSEMGKIRKPDKVCLISAICYAEYSVYENVLSRLISEFGEVAVFSEMFSFKHTEYYAKEMGETLKKQFIVFKSFIIPDRLPEIKYKTNTIENEFKIQNRRQANIDPGYIEPPKLVLATTKNYSHRIYIQNGIYGDIELYWRDGRFNIYPWTYPDYQQESSLLFFTQIRQRYIELIKKGKEFWE
ncbi:MAG: DUF4416 family protein [candidate division KSB1 bacterium]|nr:DUF4416 family protein [candidate division KSB1 bacterium]